MKLEANVLSTTRFAPTAFEASAMDLISRTFNIGFVGDSIHNISGLISAIASMFSFLVKSEYFTDTPNLLKTLSMRRYVHP